MKKFLFLFLLVPIAFLISCNSNIDNTTVSTEATASIAKATLIDSDTAKNMLENDKSIILVDVRTQSEYDSGHIEGAILLPLDKISSDASSVIPDKNRIYIVYCHSGNRSAQATAELVSMGYMHIYDLEGGISAWN